MNKWMIWGVKPPIFGFNSSTPISTFHQHSPKISTRGPFIPGTLPPLALLQQPGSSPRLRVHFEITGKKTQQEDFPNKAWLVNRDPYNGLV